MTNNGWYAIKPKQNQREEVENYVIKMGQWKENCKKERREKYLIYKKINKKVQFKKCNGTYSYDYNETFTNESFSALNSQ